MKIVYFNYISNAIGPIIRTLELAKACSDNNIEVAVYFMRKNFNPPEFILDRINEYQSQHLSIHFLPILTKDSSLRDIPPASAINLTPKAPRMTVLGLFKQALLSLRYISQEIRIIKAEHPDVVMARPDEAFSFCFSSRLTGKPLVLETDGPVEELDLFWGVSSKYFILLDFYRASSANAVLCISKVCMNLWVNKGIRPEKLFIIPNGANPDEFAPLDTALKSELKRKHNLVGARIIGYSGNQRIWHGLPNLLLSALKYLQADKNVKLLIIGCGKNTDILEEHNIPADIAEQQIIFTGRLSYQDMAKFIDLADFMVMPYDNLELFYFSPMRMFEAMSLGKLLICSKQGQMLDILNDNSAVVFFDPAKPGDLERALGESIYNEALVASGVRNREYLLNKHTWHQRGTEIRAALDYCLSQLK